jgi:hypothetical protein
VQPVEFIRKAILAYHHLCSQEYSLFSKPILSGSTPGTTEKQKITGIEINQRKNVVFCG